MTYERENAFREIAHKLGSTIGLLQTAILSTSGLSDDTKYFLQESLARLQDTLEYCNVDCNRVHDVLATDRKVSS